MHQSLLFGEALCISGVGGAQKETPLIGLVGPFHRGFVGVLWALCFSHMTGGGGIRTSAPPKQSRYNSTTISLQNQHNNELTENQAEQNHDNSKHKYKTSEGSECALCVPKQISSDIRIAFIQNHLLDLPEHILDTMLIIVESAIATRLSPNLADTEV